MKKALFAAAVLTAGFAMADITSANIVGYNNDTLIQGSRGSCAVFTNVGNTPMTLNDIKVTGYTGSYSGTDIYCCKLDSFGRSLEIYSWADYTEDDETYYGWYAEESTGDDVTLDPGEGIWVTAPNSTYKLTTSGEVYGQALPIQLIQGSRLCPNPTPVSITLNQAIISGYVGSYSGTDIYCCKLDEFGRSLEIYSWADYTEDDETYYGWYAEEGTGDDVALAPGEAVWVTAPNNTYYINFPSPIAAE